jgi:hypothetical protein
MARIVEPTQLHILKEYRYIIEQARRAMVQAEKIRKLLELKRLSF